MEENSNTQNNSSTSKGNTTKKPHITGEKKKLETLLVNVEYNKTKKRIGSGLNKTSTSNFNEEKWINVSVFFSYT